MTNTINFSFAKQNRVLVEKVDDKHASIICHGHPKATVLSELRRHLNKPLHLELVDEATFNQWLEKTYESEKSANVLQGEEFASLDLTELVQAMPKAEDLLEKQDDAPIIRLLNALFTEAIKDSASDIHIETFEDELVVRFRIDGILHEVLEPQRVLAPLIVSRIKVMAKLDIAEKRFPQDGRISLRIARRTVDVRVSTMPTNHGERIVMRLLDKQTSQLNLSSLGMAKETQDLMEQLIHSPHGIILVTGPTGSGKTTTLYAALTALNEPTRNILTIEDPIEYDLAGIGQTQVNHKVDMSFAKGLRAMLRQDPDVVMVGEIRDVDTAQIAIQASLTGHLVLSTLHTNSAIGAITRLADMGVEPFLLSSSLIGVLAQRLIRLLCPKCKEAATATQSECQILHADESNPPTIYHAKGCPDCRGIGYQKRKGIYELIAIDDTMQSLIHDNAGEQALNEYARKSYPSIRDDGRRQVLEGNTSIEELLRVTSEDSHASV